MPDLVTPYAGLTKPTVGADNNTWGALLNADMDLIDTFLRAIVPAGTVFEYAAAAAAGSEPTGFLFCDGRAVSRTTYASLFAVIATTYGAGDGSTTFNLPDRRNKVGIGAGSTYALASTGGAASFTPTITVASTTLSLAQIPSHNHTATDSGHIHVDAGHIHGMVGAYTGASLIDPGHQHGIGNLVQQGSGSGNFAAGGGLGLATVLTDAQLTGLSFSDPGHAHTITSGAASIGTGNAAITVAANGGGGGHTHTATSNAVVTLPPYIGANYIIKT